MIEYDPYCTDVLTHVSPTARALEAVALGLLDDHLVHCFAEAAEQGGPVSEEKLREASAAIARLVRPQPWDLRPCPAAPAAGSIDVRWSRTSAARRCEVFPLDSHPDRMLS